MSQIFKPLTEKSLPSDSGSADFEDFRRRVFTTIIAVAAVFGLLFGLMDDFDLNPINDFQTRINYGYSAASFLMLVFVRLKPDSFHLIVFPFMLVSHLTFTSALWTVPEDQFRAIWFFLLTLVAFMVGGSKMGFGFTGLALITVITANVMTDLQLTSVSIVSIVCGLVILSLVSNAFITKATVYSRLIEAQSQRFIKLAQVDHLTGVYNARSFYEIGNQLFRLARREKSPLSILYIDIDHFKRINDTYGHHNGDLVLQKVTRVIGSAMRESDVLARIGGEEFNVLLPDTDGAGAGVLAEKIRNLVEQTAIKMEDLEVSVTLSVGVAMLKDTDKTFEILQQRSDQLLYAAKNQGRNQVVT